MEKISGVYKITNIINGKFYIGSSLNILQRWLRHDNSFRNNNNSKYLQNAWNLYGASNFKKEILEVLVNESDDLKMFNDKLRHREQHYLDTLNPCNTNIGYNISTTAKGGSAPLSKEAKRKISQARTGIKLSDATKLKLREINLGKHHTDETKRKISANAKINPNFGTKGKTFSEESKLKMRLVKLGKLPWNNGIPHSEETKEKISKAKIGIKLSEDTKEKMRNKGNKIYYIENKQVTEFRSVREACRVTKLHHSKIREYCAGNLTINNKTWAYEKK